MKFSTKKTVKHNVGRVESVVNVTEFCVSFLKIKDDNKFIFPEKEDISDTDISEIVLKLPQPHVRGGTARNCDYMKFLIKFDTFNMG